MFRVVIKSGTVERQPSYIVFSVGLHIKGCYKLVGQWRDSLHTSCSVYIYMFRVVIDKWDYGETAFIHMFSVGLHV